MEGNWRPTQPDASLASSMDAASGDWRNQLQPEARQRIVNKIMETLKRHLPTSVPEGLNELRKIAIRFEEKIYTAATSQLDYLGKLSLKMLSMETKTQQSAPINPAISNSGGVNQNPTDPALGMQSQANNPGQPLAVPNWSAVLPQNLQNNTSASMQGSSGPAPALTSISGLTQSNISGVTQASNLQNMPRLSQGSVNNSMGQGAQTDIYANAQRQMQERQQQQRVISQQQQQQQQSQNPLVYQHQVQQRMLNQRMQQQQQQEQQQQQSLLQPNQLQSTQPSLMQMSSSLQSNQSNIQQTQAGSTQSAPQTGLQQNQLNEIQQSVPSLLQSNPQSVARQQQAQSLHQQAPSLQQQSMPISQQSNLSQQQQMMGQQGNMPNMQQNQLLGPQNSIGDIRQQQPRLPIQQNSFLSMQQQRQMMNQQTLALQQQQQQQQLGSQSNMSGLQQQQQMLGPLTSISNMQPHQRAMLMQKNAAQQQQQQQQQQHQQQQQQQHQQQQQNQQSPLTLLQSQGPQSQHQSLQQQLMSQYQSQPAQLQQQLMMQQQTNSLQREMQQRLQGCGPLLQAQNAMEQKPFIQAQRGLPEVSSSTPMDSTAQTGHAGGVDWQEECYQKVKAMKEQYFADLTEFHQKVALKLQQQEALIPPGKQSEQHEKLKSFRTMLERMLALLQINKNSIPVGMKEKLTMYEKQMVNIVTVNRSKKISPQVQGQQQFQHPNLGNAHPMRQQQQSQVSQMQPDNHANQRVKVSETVVPEEPSSSHICTGSTEKAKEPTFNCPICMCTMVSPFSTICGHIFCEDCIRAAIKRRKECPTCRAKLTGKNNIHRVFLPTAD